MKTSELKKVKTTIPLKSSWGGWRPGAGRKKNVPIPDSAPLYEISFPEIVTDLMPEIVNVPEPATKMKKRRASQGRPLTEEDKLWNRAADGNIKDLKRYLDAAFGKVR